MVPAQRTGLRAPTGTGLCHVKGTSCPTATTNCSGTRRAGGLVVPHHAPVPEHLPELHARILDRRGRAASLARVAAPERVLTRRDLNRALLERQLLLERKPLRAVQAVERLGGLQAQSTPIRYLSLWARLDGFERDELTKALTGRRLVKALLQRGTLHVAAPRTYWAMMTVRKRLAASLWPASFEARLPAARIAEPAGLVQSELAGRQLTYKEVQALLEPHATEGVPPTFLWRRVQVLRSHPRAAVRHLGLRGPRRLHGRGRKGARHAAGARGGVRPGRPAPTSAPSGRRRTGRRPVGRRAADEADRRVARAALAAELRERGQEGALRPAAGAAARSQGPAPPRLVPRFDNLVLSHADRSRILGDLAPSRIVTNNGLVHATILVDGLVAGTWQLEQGRVVLEPLKLDAAAKRALRDEAERLEAFVA